MSNDADGTMRTRAEALEEAARIADLPPQYGGLSVASDQTVATEAAAFRAGYEAAKRDAIDRALMERIAKTEPDWRTHNVAIGLAVTAIRALDVRHALPLVEDANNAR